MTLLSSSIPIVDGIAEIGVRYESWLCDIWGVLHNGERAFEPAAAACERFREQGGTVVLVSNSPRPAGRVIEQLDEIGVPRTAYDSAATSGDVTRALVRREHGARVFHLGPQRDRPIFEGLAIEFAPPDQADLVVCSGLFDDKCETPDDYAEMLAAMHARGLPMICANPDLMVERGEALVYCAGALAAAYQGLGAEVVYTGKPMPALYDMAFRRIAEHRGTPVDRERVLAVGDGLKTDLAGAAAMGLDAVFIASGLHVESQAGGAMLDPARVATLFNGHPCRPVAAMAALRW